MTTATVNLGEIAAFWRNARRLYTIYSALNRTFEIGLPLCRDLEYPVDRSEPEVLDRVKTWFDQMDTHVQVWQLRQLLQSTNLQTEENLRALIRRHMDGQQFSEIDRDKIDFLLVQYFAHCAPHGLYEQQISLVEVARVLQPVLNEIPNEYPEWADGLDTKLENLNRCNSLEELQKLGALLEVRELKLALRDKYFEKPCLIAFTRFNFLARRAFFRAMHLDLHAIRNAINDLESHGRTVVDCSEAGLTENESLEHVRHVVHQWKTPFRAPYTGGASFLQLILLRHALQKAQSQLVRAEDETGAGETAGIEKAEAIPSPSPAITVSVLEEILPSRPADMPAQLKPAPVAEARVHGAPPSSAASVNTAAKVEEHGSLASGAAPASRAVSAPAPAHAPENFAVEAAAAHEPSVSPEPITPEPIAHKAAVAKPITQSPAAAAPAVPPPGVAAPIAPVPAQIMMAPELTMPHEATPAHDESPTGVGAREPDPPESISPPRQAPVAPPVAVKPAAPAPAAESARAEQSVAEDDYLSHCVADIKQQLAAMGPKKMPAVTAINLAGCKLLISTWEGEAFTGADDNLSEALRRAVAARTILHVSVERHKKNVPTDLGAALEIAETSVEEMRREVANAKEAQNIDAAVNLAATAKRLLALIEEAEKLRA